MAKHLKTLIRLQQMDLDDKRRRLVDLEKQREELRKELHMMQYLFEREKSLARTNTELAMSFGIFAQRHQVKVNDMNNKIAHVQQLIDLTAEEVKQAYIELKKYEKALEWHVEKRRKEKDHVMQVEADDQSIMRHRRLHQTDDSAG